MAHFEIDHITPPAAPNTGRRVFEFLRHKGHPWVDDIRRRLEGRLPDAADHYFVARDSDQLVGHVWYTTHRAAPELGVIGHIYTTPTWRRQGVATRLMDAAMRHFRQSGGQLMQLYTSTPHTLDFYRRCGFDDVYCNQAHHEMDWYMCAPIGTYHDWPRPRPAACSTGELSTGALPQYCLHYNSEHSSVLKDRTQPIGMGLEAELAFIQITQQVAMGNAACFVSGNECALAATATLRRMEFAHQAHIAILDCYAVDTEQAQIASLVDRCLQERDRMGVELVYAVAVDPTKMRLFQRLGFQQHATYRKHYRVAHDRYDLTVFWVE